MKWWWWWDLVMLFTTYITLHYSLGQAKIHERFLSSYQFSFPHKRAINKLEEELLKLQRLMRSWILRKGKAHSREINFPSYAIVILIGTEMGVSVRSLNINAKKFHLIWTDFYQISSSSSRKTETRDSLRAMAAYLSELGTLNASHED